MNDPYRQAAQALRRAKYAVASTGAGISVESGIPDFRSPGGIWSKYPPDQYASIDAFLANPAKVWRFWNELANDLRGCKPNPAHHALTELQRTGPLKAIITQNVDNLHQDAGTQNIIEYHGNAKRLICLHCGYTQPFTPLTQTGSAPDPNRAPHDPTGTARTEAVPDHDPRISQDITSTAPTSSDPERAPQAAPHTGPVPRCQCGGLLKPDVIMFGEIIPPHAMAQAETYATTCDLMIIIGTSAQVYPAADLPHIAKHHGAYIIEANTQPTDFTHTITDAFLQGPAGTTLPKLLQTLKSLP